MRIIGFTFLALFVFVALLGLGWAAQGNDFFMYRYFAPKYEQVRHDTFKQSQAYNDGMLNEFYKMRAEYEGAKTQGQKDALADMILHRASQYDVERMPADLRSFVTRLRGN